MHTVQRGTNNIVNKHGLCSAPGHKEVISALFCRSDMQTTVIHVPCYTLYVPAVLHLKVLARPCGDPEAVKWVWQPSTSLTDDEWEERVLASWGTCWRRDWGSRQPGSLLLLGRGHLHGRCSLHILRPGLKLQTANCQAYFSTSLPNVKKC